MTSVPLSRSLISSRQIFHFLAIIDHGSLSRAARAVNITEPALSKSIRTLEFYLQVPLFDRTPYGLVLTVHGRSLMHHARVIAAELRHAIDELAQLSGADVGHVYVGAGPTFVQTVLPDAIASLRAEHPNLRVSVEEGYVPTLLPRVLQGELDFAVLILEAVRHEEDIARETLFQDEVVVLGGRHHPLCDKPDASAADLAQASWVLPPQDDKLSIALQQAFDNLNVTPPRAMIETSSTNFAKRLVAQSDYLTYAPRALFQSELISGQFYAFSNLVPPLIRTVGLIYRRQWTQSPAAIALLNKLRENRPVDFPNTNSAQLPGLAESS